MRPSAAELVAFARRFLGLFMINRFDILMFLEDAGDCRCCSLHIPGSTHHSVVSISSLLSIPVCAWHRAHHGRTPLYYQPGL